MGQQTQVEAERPKEAQGGTAGGWETPHQDEPIRLSPLLPAVLQIGQEQRSRKLDGRGL